MKPRYYLFIFLAYALGLLNGYPIGKETQIQLERRELASLGIRP